MKSHLLLIFVILGILLPQSYGEAVEKDITIKISPDGKTRMTENLAPLPTLSSIKIQPISSAVTNILATDENNVILRTTLEDGFIRIDTLGATKVRLVYDADIVKKELGLWRLVYKSNLESTIFLPSNSNIVSVNTIPLDIVDDSITMPAGEVTISYTVRVINSNTFVLSKDDSKYFVNIMTSSGVTNFNHDSKSVSFRVDNDATILAIIPSNFLDSPYEIQLNKAPIEFKQYYQNTTHYWLRIEPTGIGLITISKTVSPITEISDESKQKGGCLIATATYGSELAPQVQNLREIRDNTLLKTESGSFFMEGFNTIYYTFSPTIADWERQNAVFKEFVKITITPLLTSLSILNYVDINSEQEMLVYGIGIIMLNITMYFVAPTFAILKIKRLKNGRGSQIFNSPKN